MRRILIALLLAGYAASCVMDDTCPCGQAYEGDPFDPAAELSFPVEHLASDHCWCRCGEAGLPERLPPARDCSGYETVCERGDGDRDTYRCD